jgi:hypothetical protein
MSNISDDQLLRRAAVAEDLRSMGYTITAKTLATMACRGGGPPYQLFGRIPLYRRGAARAWAAARLTPPGSSTSEHERLAKANAPGGVA